MRTYLTKSFIFLRVVVSLFFATACEIKIETISLNSYIIALDESVLKDELRQTEDYDEKCEIVREFVSSQFPMIRQVYITNTYSTALVGFSAQLSKDAIKRIESYPYVVTVEPTNKGDIKPTTTEAKSCRWNVNRVGGRVDCSKKKSVAWVLDSGISFTHPDLKVDKDRSRSFVGYGNGEDDNGHGTHIGGIIAAEGSKCPGVASGATLASVKVTSSDGKGKVEDLIKGVDYVAASAKEGDVVNISLGGPYFETFHSAVSNTVKLGVYIVIAAGNDSKSIDDSQLLSSIPDVKHVYVVAALDSTDQLADNSNYGRFCCAAPGVDIRSTWHTPPEGYYKLQSGTSMAAPHVAGVLLASDGQLEAQDSVAYNGISMPLYTVKR